MFFQPIKFSLSTETAINLILFTPCFIIEAVIEIKSCYFVGNENSMEPFCSTYYVACRRYNEVSGSSVCCLLHYVILVLFQIFCMNGSMILLLVELMKYTRNYLTSFLTVKMNLERYMNRYIYILFFYVFLLRNVEKL